MLLEFKVSNYRSIGEEQTISLIPAPKQKDNIQNIISKGTYQALNAIAFYGPNGGGKSNILKAMSLLNRLVQTSAGTASTARLPYDPFLLREGWKDKPTGLEISFVAGENRYRYGLEFTADEIKKEWLFRKSAGPEVKLFEREGETIDVSSGYKGSEKNMEAAIEATRVNALFLSTCDMLNMEEAKTIMKWFKYFNLWNDVNKEKAFQPFPLSKAGGYQENIRCYVSNLNLGILDLQFAEKEFKDSDLPSGLPENVRNQLVEKLKGGVSVTTYAEHKVYDSEGNPTKETLSWNLSERESSGTQKAFHLGGPVLWTLAKGGILIIDEIEAAMHPMLTLQTINLFLNTESNPNKAQLIFATHDTNLLTSSNLRRDQICFAEKNKWESTEIYALSDFVYFGEKNGEFKSEKERPDTDKEKRYFEGRYGAIPALGNFQKFIGEISRAGNRNLFNHRKHRGMEIESCVMR